MLSLLGLVLAAVGFALAGADTTTASLVAQRHLETQGSNLYDLLVRPSSRR